ncbi:3-oxoacyl-ACP reductase FabG [Mitsuaria sp. WAJ17]|uniref:3-oxoacyl-ACP reductase FabG n=1 Tax=Mitsuaria sp. WAJ17 TaxID=2761452 RepID=UPI001601F77D|nr:3-oxoacyl-ACP reductase FabG [Mitsuaria sp. WAJ17]MBB2485687.1 3-oxoacyl-ACP reductase FabG [Mitsuaria sp. WAJ17]
MRGNVIVTGGARGIGEAVVRELVRHDYRVGFTYFQSESRALALVEELGKHRVCCAKMELRSPESIKSALGALQETLGTVQGLVNSAGIRQDQSFAAMRDEAWADVINCNLNSVYQACKMLVPGMTSARQGSIVNVASISGIVGVAGQSNYAASKSALIGLTKSLSKELGPRGVRVNVLAPGFIDTDMTASLSEDYVDEMVDRISLRRFGNPGEIAQIVRFLLSDEASYITGQVIVADGGLTG